MWVVYAVRKNSDPSKPDEKFQQEFRSRESAQDICKDLYMEGYDRIGISRPRYRQTYNNQRPTKTG